MTDHDAEPVPVCPEQGSLFSPPVPAGPPAALLRAATAPAGVPGSTLTLRPYQEEAVQTVFTEADGGTRKQLIVLPTGSGKTPVFAEIARRLNGRTLVLAHRDELIRQAVDKIRMVWPSADIGVVKAGEDGHDAQVVVASVQTLCRPNRLDRVLRPFDLVIVDEAHHARADTYKTILDRFGCFREDGPLLVGVTATPDRGDKQGLDVVFDKIVFHRDIRWGIEEGYLSDLRAIEIMLKLDLREVKTSNGDYQDGDLGAHMMEADAPEHIVRAWFDHAKERKTLVFSPTVAMAVAVKDEFKKNNVRVAEVNGTTPMDERRAMLSLFHDGEIQVLSNCGVAVEGFDEPSIDCILMARPTKSRPAYQQMIGRGSRRFPGKKDCLILDVVGIARHHQLVTAATLLGADAKKMANGQMSFKQSLAAVAADAAALLRPPAGKGKLVAEEIDLWKQFKDADFAWVPTRQGFTLPIANGQIALMKVTEDGYGVVFNRRTPDGDSTRTILSQTRMGLPVEVAQGIAEDWVRANQAFYLSIKDAPWRSKPASEKQKNALRKWKVPIPPELTAGEASDLMTQKIAEKQATGG